MYRQIGYGYALLVVGYLTQKDIQEKKIPVNILLLSLGIGGLYLIIGENVTLQSIVDRMFPVMLLFLVSLLTKESIGYGDDIVVLILGIFCGGTMTFGILGIAILLSSMYSLLRLLRKKKEPFAFLPFLLVSMEVMFWYG